MIRNEVSALVNLGPLPLTKEADTEKLLRYQNLLDSIEKPVSDDEARALVTLFGPDDCFGLAWTLVHLIETSPGWPMAECLNNTENQWIVTLRNSAIRAGRLQD